MDVLVADDDPDIRFLVGSVLHRRGWSVTTADSGEQTLDLLAGDARFDAIVADQTMPPGSGLAVYDWLRDRGDATPFVLFTGYVSSLQLGDRDVTVLDKVETKRLPDVLAALTSGSAT